jgi:hypothetical protein
MVGSSRLSVAEKLKIAEESRLGAGRCPGGIVATEKGAEY